MLHEAVHDERTETVVEHQSRGAPHVFVIYVQPEAGLERTAATTAAKPAKLQ